MRASSFSGVQVNSEALGFEGFQFLPVTGDRLLIPGENGQLRVLRTSSPSKHTLTTLRTWAYGKIAPIRGKGSDQFAVGTPGEVLLVKVTNDDKVEVFDRIPVEFERKYVPSAIAENRDLLFVACNYSEFVWFDKDHRVVKRRENVARSIRAQFEFDDPSHLGLLLESDISNEYELAVIDLGSGETVAMGKIAFEI